MQLEILCRICLKEGSMIPIFTTPHKFEENTEILCSEMLIACATVTVSEEDALPRQICLECFEKLCASYSFRKLCESTHSYLLEKVSKDNIVCKIKLEEDDASQTVCNNIFDVNVIRSDKILLGEEYIKKEKDDYIDNDVVSDVYLSSKHKRKTPKKQNIKKKPKLALDPEKSNHSDDTHKKNKHKRPGYPCSFCSKVLKRKCLLEPHEDSHLGIKRYFCKLCNKSYRSEKNHVQFHKRGFNFKCESCSKFFNTKSKLAIHLVTHEKNREKKYFCDIDGCKKSYFYAVSLDQHKEIHIIRGKYMCHLCSKKFINEGGLKIHLLRHSGVKEFKCSHCDKSFYDSRGRDSHELRHTNTRNYPCSQCDKKFTLLSVLKKHLLCHNERKEECRGCGKKFARRDNRRNHELAMHGIPKTAD